MTEHSSNQTQPSEKTTTTPEINTITDAYQLDVKQIISGFAPELGAKLKSKWLLGLLGRIFHIKQINAFIEDHHHLKGFAFLDETLKYFDFRYKTVATDLQNIPQTGRLIVVANHPLGGLDGLALLKLVRSVRPDVKIVANEVLSTIENLDPLFLQAGVFSKNKSRSQFSTIINALENEEAVLIFPAGEVSRLSLKGIKDGVWRRGFVRMMRETKSPVLPIHIKGRNSYLFYVLSWIFKYIGTAMLIHEMFKQRKKSIMFEIGKPIQPSEDDLTNPDMYKVADKYRKHVYRLEKIRVKKRAAKRQKVTTFIPVAHAVDRQALKKDLMTGEMLGETPDNKKIILYNYRDDSPVMTEIGRLREMAFRTVNEGTGTAADIDRFDVYYKHIILWDDNDLEIVGAYRIAECKEIIEKYGVEGLYTDKLFIYAPEMTDYFNQGIELGRSFIQPKYFGLRGLDYLWLGIGAYLHRYPQIRYLFGAVSLSDAFPEEAKQKILSFYMTQFGDDSGLVKHKHPYEITDASWTYAREHYAGEYKAAYRKLNTDLGEYGVKVPPLYKQYSELSDKREGCRYLCYGVDTSFGNCIDCFIVVDTTLASERKRARYLTVHEAKPDEQDE